MQHDKIDNIPISLELRNLPSMILSMAHVHGIHIGNSTSNGNVNQLSSDLQESNDKVENDDIKIIKDDKKVKTLPKHTVKFSSNSPSTSVQCWLCDGPHSFRQCQDIARMKSVCIKRPSVLKHFQQLILDRNGEAIRAMLDAPEFFDESLECASNNYDDADQVQDSDQTNEEQISSLHIGMNEVDENDIITSFKTGKLEMYTIAKFENIMDF
jgi:hypothetical protein